MGVVERVDVGTVKHIDRVVATYIRDECEMLPHLSKSLNPDLKAVATDGSPENVIQVWVMSRWSGQNDSDIVSNSW